MWETTGVEQEQEPLVALRHPSDKPPATSTEKGGLTRGLFPQQHLGQDATAVNIISHTHTHSPRMDVCIAGNNSLRRAAEVGMPCFTGGAGQK